MKPWIPWILVLGLASSALAAPPVIPADHGSSQPAQKRLQAVRIDGQPPKIDGKLDEAVWKLAQFSADFRQKDPVEGAPATDKTEVAILYSDEGLYIGARLHSRDPQKLRMHLDRRDRWGPAEQFIVSIDSHHDRRTAYEFGVNTAGVQFDMFNPQDQEQFRDFTFDRVWHAHTGRDSVSWTVEMHIPFSQLRFSDNPEQVWGINFNRFISDRNEDVYWVQVPKNESGWASRFGELVGIQGIKPSRRLEVLPYVVGDASIQDGNFQSNPFSNGKDTRGSAGADLKMGLGPSLTLDATFNPDFGQVELDPAVVNLSAYETIFDERRPFFTEGVEMLSGPDAGGYFYSRRIGAPPHGWGYGTFTDQPKNTSILGAAKLTGQMKSGMSVGILTAVTQREYVQNYDTLTDSTWESELEPTTFYSVGRLQQQFGPNQSTAGLMVTAVERDMDAGSFLDSLLRKRALAAGADWRLRFGGGMYELFGMAGFSRVEGSETSMLLTQLSSARYFQRPDADWVELDPTRTSLSGYRGLLQFQKRAGRHWLWSVFYSTKSPGFELNDLGALNTSDDNNFSYSLTYRETTPGSLFRGYNLRVYGNTNFNYGWIRQFASVGINTSVTWPNFWTSYFEIDHQISGQDDGKTRGGPSMQNEAGVSLSAGFSNNFAATTRYGLNTHLGLDELDGWLWNVNGNFSTRFGTRWQLSLSPNIQLEDQPRMYVSTVRNAGGGTDTYGARYVFARLDRSTISLQVRMNYFFTPNLSLEVYAEPYASAGHYYDHGELVAANGHSIRVYDNISAQHGEASGRSYYAVTDGSAEFTVPNRDFGVRSFRSNMVLRWEFNPGSTLYMVWQRNLGEDREIGRSVRVGSLFDSFGASGEDFFALKVSYWIPLS